jgi:folate-dependent phosphoribosylglycinamide formyltransferase PurN
MNVRSSLRRVRSSGCWRPSTAVYLVRQRKGTGPLHSDDHALRAAAGWLARAQDVTGDGGIAGRYRLAGGWSSSYPETTGYSIPTLLKLADVLDDDSFRARASRCVDFLLAVQLPSGAFPGLEIADNRTDPSPFNSAQIIHGLHRWHVATGDRRVLDPIVRAGRWICSVQDNDGAWRQHFYRQLACAYSAHAACWLAEIGVELNEPLFRSAAERNARWVLDRQDPETGWFDCAGFSEADHRGRRAHTHTIAYTLDGLLRIGESLRIDEAVDAARNAAGRLMIRFERSATLAGVLNHRWQPQARFVCLTGNAQTALIWLRLAHVTRDARFVNAAFKAIDEIKRAQVLAHPDAGISGGVPGSAPIGGDYIQFAIPNWAAKFYIDALCAKRDCLASGLPSLRVPTLSSLPSLPIDIGHSSPRPYTGSSSAVVVYTSRISPKFAALAHRWRDRQFSPALVVVEEGRPSAARRLWRTARRREDDAVTICRREGWRFLRAASVNSESAVQAIDAVEPALAVCAGAGILRPSVLAVPRLGTINAHMGILPAYRGMNVAEWAAFHGDAIGCSAYWVDAGIDTGPVIEVRQVDTAGCSSIGELRDRVDRAQLALLDDTLRAILEHADVPAGCPQQAGDGRQFFRMHEDLRHFVEAGLCNSVSTVVSF